MTKFFVDEQGRYQGGFDGAEPPPGSIEVPYAPDHADDLWTGGSWVKKQQDIASLVAQAWEAIKAERDGPRTEGGVLVGADWFHSDSASRIKWLGLKDSARDMLAAGALQTDIISVDGAAVYWKTMGGAFVPATVERAMAVVDATKVLDKRLFQRAEEHYTAVKAAPDPGAYDYSTGWPARYVDTLT